MIAEVRPDQATLVPDPPEALTSNAGWRLQANAGRLQKIVTRLRELKVRSSLFIDPFRFNAFELAALQRIHPDRVELYTERFAQDYAGPRRSKTTGRYAAVAAQVQSLGIAVNAGHDLNSQNLAYLLREVPEIIEVSIGHAFIAESLYQGFRQTLMVYRRAIAKAGGSGRA